jgi:hypothetical protein
MPVDYKKGKIYKIECQETNRVYVGSTCQPTVAARLKGHVKCNKQYKQGSGGCVSSYSILDTGNYRCTLICNFPCESKDELTAHEATWIRKYQNDCDYVCVNKCIPGRTLTQYYKDNKESIYQKVKQRREDNKEALIQYRKQYYELNKEACLQNNKQYNEDNKDAIKQKRNVKHVCQCGGTYSQSHKSCHKKTKKHQAYLLSTLDKKDKETFEQ